MPWLVLAMASGFRGDERFDLAVVYGRIAFPYILFISLAALLSGVLNATGRFVAAAAAPVLLNVLFISAMVLADLKGWPVGDTLIWAVPVAGIAQLALVWVAASRAGFRLGFSRPRLTPEMKHLAAVAFPAMLAGGVVQINLLVGRQVASFFDGAIAWLSYADRLYQLPLGVVGIAIGVVLLPDLSRRLRADDTSRRAPCAQPRRRDFAGAHRARRRGARGDPPAACLGPVPAGRLRRGRRAGHGTRCRGLRGGAPGLRPAEGAPAALLRPRGHQDPLPLRALGASW